MFQGLTNPLGKPVCSLDPVGLIFAAGVESQAIKLYDLRAFDKVEIHTHPVTWHALMNLVKVHLKMWSDT